MNNILITGGTGFFGRAFVERILCRGAYRVCIYSRDEWKQAQMKEQLTASFYYPERLRWFIGDVRDQDRLRRAMEGIEIVVHAAALKRIEVGNYAPDEMIKTNVGGTSNVVEAAFQAKVKKVVMLSTDKAYQPVSPYGQTKALAESIVLNANNMYGEHGPKYSVVRYGNVAGSTGSVIPIWRKMLETSDTVPVTDPNCTRFMMRADEAVDLVLNTVETMQGGERNIPQLPAFSIGDLATAMGAEMNITGLPKWEKMHECMAEGNCSNTARRMTIPEIKEALIRV